MTPPLPRSTPGWCRPGRLLLGAVAGTASVAAGSTPQAWREYAQEVISACTAISGLRSALPAGERVDFDDRVGYSTLLLAGHYPQPHMKDLPARELCLFDKRTRTAAVAEADGIIRRKAGATTPLGH